MAMKSSNFFALGLDVGGTKTAGGIVKFPEGTLMIEQTIPTRPDRGGDLILAEVLELAKGLAQSARARQMPVKGVGVGVCELVDHTGAVVSGNCLAWQSVPVRDQLASIAPTMIEADVRAAALGEALFGAGKPYRIFLYVTVGTGISSCLMIDGRAYLGARGATGTMASSPLPRIERDAAGAGLAPTLEQLASGAGLVGRYQQAGGQAQSARDLFTAAANGDELAAGILCSAGDTLGAGIGWLVNVLDPEAVVIGGGLGLSEGPYREALVASTRRHIWSKLNRDLPIELAALGPAAGVIGAAAAAWKTFATGAKARRRAVVAKKTQARVERVKGAGRKSVKWRR